MIALGRRSEPMRSRLIGMGSVRILAFGVAIPLVAQQGPCDQIAAACKSAGFTLGGASTGTGLQKDCVIPIIQGATQPAAARRPLPEVDPRLVAACKARRPDVAQGAAPSASAVAVAGGEIVDDGRLGVLWLSNGNLPATETFGVAGISKNGSMDYATAVRWVQAMNAFNHGAGYLGHNNWQLPTTPGKDLHCDRTGRHGESFGFHCSGSALGSLYYNTLGLQEPNTAVPIPSMPTGPFSNFQPYLYWSKSPAADPSQGFVSFSFNTGFQGANVWRNHLYVLPMIRGKLPGTPPAEGGGLQVNPGGQTVYDPASQVTWLADANLARTQTFGVADISPDGSMDHNTAALWISAMNKGGYLGHTQWELPETGAPDPSCTLKGTTGFDCTASPMGELYYKQLRLARGASVVSTPDVKIGAFHNIQPYLYWACEADAVPSACQTSGPADGFEWNFSFGNGFQGTNLVSNYLYVIVYSPH
jgi:hypothetical protein